MMEASIVLCGLGGQGVLTASDILARAAFGAGFDVKTAQVHGMSQRGGSVRSDVRFGIDLRRTSPMVPAGRADYVVVLEDDQFVTVAEACAPSGIVVSRAHVRHATLANPRSRNVAILGALSRLIENRIAPAHFEQAIRDSLPEKLHTTNLDAFAQGRQHAAFGARDTAPENPA
jgi:indolepyruvate ferredoxin oxidoreductase beta subunit